MMRLWYWYLDYWFVAWLQFRALFSRRVPAAFADGDRDPVLLIAGVWEPWYFLRGIGDRLNRMGHPVLVCTAIGYNRASIAQVAAIAEAFIVERDLHRVTIVAHSKGGLVGKAVMASTERVDQLIAVATPFSGSTYANFMPTRALREFRPADAGLLALAANLALNARITSIYPAFDPHIPGGSALDGAVNVEIATVGHFRVLADERVIVAVESALDGKNRATPGVE